MNYILFDDNRKNNLLPFTHTRPIADIRCGILTMRNRWEKHLQNKTSTLSDAYLQEVFPIHFTEHNIYINSAVIAHNKVMEAIHRLELNHALVQGNTIIAYRTASAFSSFDQLHESANSATKVNYEDTIIMLQNVWDIFSLNGKILELDFEHLTLGRESEPLPKWVTVVGDGKIFIEKGAVINPCIINTTAGSVYIGMDAEIMEGCLIRAPFALCTHAVLKMGAKIYGPTTIGDGCKVGGEVNNVVFFANSNKGHDGFIGNAVIGEWCNLGADTNCSNLKNNYDEVKIWSETEKQMIKTGLQFCGLLMGDHSKCGINTMFNTGTVVGVSCNIFGASFPDKFIPSFTWGGVENTTQYNFGKAIEAANKMMQRRNTSLTESEEKVLWHIFNNSIGEFV